MSDIPATREAITTLLDRLHKGGAWAYWWTDRGKESAWWEVGQPVPIPESWHNVYFGVHPTSSKGGQYERSKIPTIAAINCLFAEYDAKDFPGGKSEALNHVNVLPVLPSVLINSGGGYHAYWLLQETYHLTTEADRKRAQAIQAAWVKYTGGDPGAKDLARVLRVPGSLNHKYDPPRPVEFVWASYGLLHDLNELEAMSKPQEAPRTAQAGNNGRYSTDAGAYWLKQAVLKAHPGSRNETGLWLATQLRDSRLAQGEAESIMLDYAHQAPASDNPYTEGEALASLRSAYSRPPREPATLPGTNGANPHLHKQINLSAAPEMDSQPAEIPATINEILLRESIDHEGHARCVAALHAGKFCYSEAWGWMIYNGRYWQRENAELQAERAIVETLKARRLLAVENNHEGQFEKLIKATAASAQNVNGTKHLLASLATAAVDQFDSDPDLLNCQNGVLNLKTGELTPHNRAQKFTYCVPVDYDPEADYSKWVDFLLEATGYDEELTAFLRPAVGYSLTGHTWEECLFYVFGPARSGKGTFTETLIKMLGNKPLATEADFMTFTADRYGDTQNFDLAPLKPCRFVAASESNKHQPLNAAKVKALTGGNYVYCAFKHREHFSYRPQFKIWLSSNHPINVDTEDEAAWGRVKVIEFPVSRLGHEDKTLKRDMVKPENLRGVLRWAVDGAREWYQAGNGLEFPESIAKATQRQRSEQDFIQSWIDERIDAGGWTQSKIAYADYKDWCDSNGVPAKFVNQFGQALKAKGYELDRIRVDGKLLRVINGLKLKV